MSTVNKRKHAVREVLQETLEVPSEHQSVVRVLASRGNNLHEVEEPCGSRYLVSMPVKFRRNFWIKRGDFVLIEPIPEGDKVKGEIILILTREHQEFYNSNGCWPQEFQRSKDTSDLQNDGDLFVNTNRPPVYESNSDSETGTEDDATDESDPSDSESSSQKD